MGTGSVSLLSDAADSLVNVVAAVSVIVALTLAARGPDVEHPDGHQKAEYLSSVFEATLILLAAGAPSRSRRRSGSGILGRSRT